MLLIIIFDINIYNYNIANAYDTPQQKCHPEKPPDSH